MFFSINEFALGHRPTRFDKWALANASYKVIFHKRTLANTSYMYEMKSDNYGLVIFYSCALTNSSYYVRFDM